MEFVPIGREDNPVSGMAFKGEKYETHDGGPVDPYSAVMLPDILFGASAALPIGKVL
jgi:hypothetical protein